MLYRQMTLIIFLCIHSWTERAISLNHDETFSLYLFKGIRLVIYLHVFLVSSVVMERKSSSSSLIHKQ